jgi:transcriptional regulator with XRE-family HTH domain
MDRASSVPDAAWVSTPLGEMLRKAREARGWTLLQATVQIGLPDQNMLNRYETGRARPMRRHLDRMIEVYELNRDLAWTLRRLAPSPAEVKTGTGAASPTFLAALEEALRQARPGQDGASSRPAARRKKRTGSSEG